MKGNSILKIKKEIEVNGCIEFVGEGNSMYPLIAPGSIIKVKKIPNQNMIKLFDILVFQNQKKLYCHYFWFKNKIIGNSQDDKYIITRPLNPINGFDLPITEHDIIGLVTNYKITWWFKMKIIFSAICKKFDN